MTLGYWFLDGAVDKDENWYFFGINIKGFFAWNKKANSVKLLDKLDDMEYVDEMYSNGYIADDKIFFPPRKAGLLAIYHITENSLFFIDIFNEEQKKKWDIQPSPNGYHVIQRENILYFFHRDKLLYFKLDLTDDCISFPNLTEIEQLMLAKDFFIRGDKVYFPCVTHSKLVIFDFYTENYEVLEQKCILNSIIGYENEIYLMPMQQNYLIRQNMQTKEEKMIFLSNIEIDYGHNYFLSFQNGSVVLIPMFDNKGDMNEIIIIDTIGEEVKEYPIFSHYSGYKKWRLNRDHYKIFYLFYKGGIHAPYWIEDYMFICLDIKDMSVQEVHFPLPENMDEKDVTDMVVKCQGHKYLNYGGVVYEQADSDLERYMTALCGQDT